MNKLIKVNPKELKCELLHSMDYPFVRSVLSGMNGSLYVDNLTSPKFLYAKVGVYHIIKGSFNSDLANNILSDFGNRGWIVTDNHKFYDYFLEKCKENATIKERYSMQLTKYRPEIYEEMIHKLPKYLRLTKMDYDLANKIERDWCHRLYGAFENSHDFVNRGICFCIQDEKNNILSGASSHALLPNGIEFQLMTHPKFEGKGYAQIVSARLLLYCQKNGLQPYWEASSLVSRHIAEKIGFTHRLIYQSLYIDFTTAHSYGFE